MHPASKIDQADAATPETKENHPRGKRAPDFDRAFSLDKPARFFHSALLLGVPYRRREVN
jgi:hypothetical protein